MFKIQNDRLSYGGISFSLPNGLYLDTDIDSAVENGIEFVPEDGSFRIMLRLIHYEKTAEEYIEQIKQDQVQADHFIYGDNHPHLKPTMKINLNGLDGFAFQYKDDVDAHFNSAYGNDIHLSIYIETKNIKDVLARQDVKEFFAGIRVESDAVEKV